MPGWWSPPPPGPLIILPGTTTSPRIQTRFWIEFGGRQLRVTPAQLDADARAQAWQRITQLQPRYAGYEQKTDRAIPVIQLSRAD